jgi:hypothetical protein
MKSEDALREALQRAAERHRVNSALRRATVVKARAARALTVAGAVAVVAGLVIGGAGAVDALRDEPRSVAPAGETISAPQRTVDGVPLLLVTAEGWRVARADQYEGGGELTFTNDGRSIELFWRTPDTHEDYFRDRESGSEASWDVTLAGSEATLFQYEGVADFTALWLAGDHSLELRGAFPDVDSYREVAETLAWVDEETWLAALPEETVPPSRRAAVVDEMLADVPVPPDAPIGRLKERHKINDRYQLGADATAAVACAWIDQWADASERGDDEAVREAVAAMETSRGWAILREMESQGGWSETLWEYADAMAGKGQLAGDRPIAIAEHARQGLGCR